MAKLNKSALKEIIKECLVEILSEGLGAPSGEQLYESIDRARQKKKQRSKTARRRPALDSVKFNQRVDESVSSITSDPVMASIFKDTAKTTLQEQMNSNSGAPGHLDQIAASGDAAAKAVSKSDPTQIFGESSRNWATLAFS